ncbi:MAG: MogA/MoaB family molybdenum cofactor biosynthesis protein [Candidatus Firestonebacteria bacterium]|nr:MogA/MoaB family molybdenum cofactor biosynthesis protein [Candidatus Firestonebacteria bacterium]
MIAVGILVMSDRAFQGKYEDKSGKTVQEIIEEDAQYKVKEYEIIPDEKDIIVGKLKEYTDIKKLDLIITSGGTGLSTRDVTPEATREVIEKEIPGMAEAMRKIGIEKTPFAMLSRAIVGLRKKTLIINLPGSPKAVRENLEVVLPVIPHALGKH